MFSAIWAAIVNLVLNRDGDMNGNILTIAILLAIMVITLTVNRVMDRRKKNIDKDDHKELKESLDDIVLTVKDPETGLVVQVTMCKDHIRIIEEDVEEMKDDIKTAQRQNAKMEGYLAGALGKDSIRKYPDVLK